MGNIVLLDDLTINQIAAGEVIERPASVVKELIENSIDAGSTRITVEIKNGGISFIRVSDNGKGIEPDDMEMAFERHATSKIRRAEDILNITSMGFRGEALASIAAIANVEMVSRKKDTRIGHRIVVEGGIKLEESETGYPVGTTITVKNLFYNTPVRYKFLKKDYTESGYIEDAITRAALVNPNISFRLINSGKTVIQTSGNGEIADVIYSIYGKDIASNVISVNYEFEDIKVSGMAGKPEIARSNRTQQLFFVNGRYVKNRTLTAAAEQAYKDIIPANKYAFLVLNVEISPNLIDVNVHPAKLEIKFEDENKAFKAVYHAIKEAIEKINEKPKVEENPFSKHIKHNHFEELNQIKKPENLEEKSDMVFEAIRDDSDEYREKKSSKFFKKKQKENEFGTNENLMEEVYKFRKGLKEIGVAEVSAYTPIVIPTNEEEEKQLEQELIENNKNTVSQETEEIVYDKELKESAESVEEDEEKSIFDDILNVAEKETENIREEENEPELIEEKPIEEDIIEYSTENDESLNGTLISSSQENEEEKDIISTPSEEDVEKRALEIIKNREQKDYTNIEQKDNPKTSFSDMYSKIFGNTISSDSVKVNEEKLTEKEKSLFDEIRNSVIRKEEKQEETEIERNLNDSENDDVSDLDNINEVEMQNSSEETKDIIYEKNDFTNAEVEEQAKDADEVFVPVRDDDYVEANSNEIVFSGNIEDDENEGNNSEEKINEEESLKETEVNEDVEEKNETIEEQSQGIIAEVQNSEIEEVASTGKNYRVVGEAFNQYAIMEYPNEMAIVDVKEANEKLIYNRVKEAFYGKDKDNQTMLMADVIPLTNKETDLIKEYLNLFESAGFELEAFGENTIKLSTVPNVCIDMNTKHLFLELLDDCASYEKLSKEDKEDCFIKNISKKVADTIELDEIEGGSEKIIDELYETDNPLNYDDGRSIAMKLSKYDIERKFSRK